MTRPPRLEYAGARYHVINRGNYRRNVFHDDGASEAFERTLGESAERFGWKVSAYVVMRNHFHLALETPEPNLSVGMKWLQGTWARRFNRFRGEIGRPFQGRFKSLVIEDGEGFRRVCDYIHLNPVRARLVEPSAVGAYRWSSLCGYLNEPIPTWLNADWLLQAHGLTRGHDGWSAYVTRLAVLMDDKTARENLSAKHLSRGWCIGSKEFRKNLQESMKDQLSQWRERRYAGLEPDELKAERTTVWTETLAAYARAATVDLTKLGPRKSAPEKVLLAAAMKTTTSVGNGWLAEHLQMGEPASVSQFVRRWLASDEKKRAVETLVAKVARA